MKAQITGIKGHRQGNLFYPPGAVLEITETTYKNMPDKFSPVLAEVKPQKIKEVKVPVKSKEVKIPDKFNEKKEEEKIELPSFTYPFRIGGAWYRLSNGKKIQGKTKALTAEKALE